MTTQKIGSIERKAADAISDLLAQLSDLANVIAGDIDAAEAGTSIVEEIDRTRDVWGETAKVLTRLRAKCRRAESP